MAVAPDSVTVVARNDELEVYVEKVIQLQRQR